MPISATTFSERLGRIDERSKLPNRGEVLDLPKPRKPRPSFLKLLIGLPLGLAFGAGSVLLAGIVKVAVFDGGVTPETALPPDGTGFLAFFFLLASTTLVAKAMDLGRAAEIAIAFGFVTMWFGEGYFMDQNVDLWVTMYDGQYIPEAIRSLGADDTYEVSSAS